MSGNYAVTWDVAATDVAPVLSPAVDIFLSVDGGSTFDVANPLAQGVPNDGEHTVVFPVTITASARLMIRGSNHIFYDVSDSDFIVSGTGTGLCPVGDQSDIFAEDWESGNTNQWAVNDIIPGNSWVNSASNPDQGLRHLHVDNPGTTTDSAFEWVSSQPISGSTYVFVKHQYNFEQYYDGGVIEYSSDGGINWLDISGLPVLLGSYPLALNFGSDNPLTGRSAFSGSSPGYIGTMVDLSSLSGSNVLLRFRVGTDSSVSAPGWDIDEVFLYQCTSIVARSCGGLPLTVDMALGQMPAVGNVSEVIGGTSGDDSINGYGGNDVICGFDGQDTLIGGPGSDTLYGGDSFGGDDSFNTLLGGTGADTLIGGPFDDQLYGQGGADYLESNNLTNSQDFLSGGSGNDVLRSYSVGGSTRRGNGNNDTLYGSASADNMTGDPGLDILYGNGGADIMSGGNGADILHGGRGDDELSGKGARDDLYGDRGNDILLGGNGNDDLDGGEGIDTCNGQGQETAGIGDTATNCETTSGVPRPASSISELSAR